MLHQNFRSYQLAVNLYRECKELCVKGSVPSTIKDQLLRASSSVALNLSEGSAKPTLKDRQRYYSIAFASLREVQSIIDLEHATLNPLAQSED